MADKRNRDRENEEMGQINPDDVVDSADEDEEFEDLDEGETENEVDDEDLGA